jgi:hypothetical protein
MSSKKYFLTLNWAFYRYYWEWGLSLKVNKSISLLPAVHIEF